MGGNSKSIVATMTAVVGLLTAIVVLVGSLTDQGWLPSFVKEPVQSVIPGSQSKNDVDTTAGRDRNDNNSGKSTTTDKTQSPTGPAYGPDTCIQGYVWREAVPADHVCVTPETREQTLADNALADSRRNPDGGDYGPDTCLQGYVWREAVADDHVCVEPGTRDQAYEDNALADSRRVRQ